MGAKAKEVSILPPFGQRCVNCILGDRSRPGDLCVVCYLKPSVRKKVAPSTRVHAVQDVMAETRQLCGNTSTVVDGEDVTGPTRWLPGTNGKLKVMERRVELGLKVFHPLDASFESLNSRC